MLLNTGEYKESLGRVVKAISSARPNAAQKASAEMIRMYWLIGNELVARSEWGNKYIETLSKDIRAAFPGIRGFSVRSLKYMAKFAREVDSELCSSCCTIPWGHMMLLLDKTEPGKERLWYLNATIENGWSRVVLDHQIDLQLYERQQLAGKVTNFSRTLPAPESELAQQALKDPYVFDFITTRHGHREHEIEQQMVENATARTRRIAIPMALTSRRSASYRRSRTTTRRTGCFPRKFATRSSASALAVARNTCSQARFGERGAPMETMAFTSVSAVKLIKRLENEKVRLVSLEGKNSTYALAQGEECDPPTYDFASTWSTRPRRPRSSSTRPCSSSSCRSKLMASSLAILEAAHALGRPA